MINLLFIHQLVIINLQKTPFDSLASIRIFGKTDDVMKLLMEELNIEVSCSIDVLPTWDARKAD